MKIFSTALFLALCALPGAASFARPVTLEPVATLPAPPGGFYRYGTHVAIDGDYALITAFRPDPDGSGHDMVAGLLYRRTASGAWVYDSLLDEALHDTVSSLYTPSVALRNGYAALNFAGIYRRTSSGWVREADSGGLGHDVEYSNGRFVFGTGEGDWGANLLERSASGAWTATRIMGAHRPGDTDNNGGPLDIDGDRLALAAPYVTEEESAGPRIFRYRAETGWDGWSRPRHVEGLSFGEELALRGNELFVDAHYLRAWDGTYLFGDDGINEWNPDWQFKGRLQTVDSYVSRSVDGSVEKSPEYVFQHRLAPAFGNYVWNVFRANAQGRYEHVATLWPGIYDALGLRMDIDSNRRVIVGSAGYSPDTGYRNTVRIFELPAATPVAGTVISDAFTTGSPASYQRTAGFVLATENGRTVFRQQDTSGDARALHDASARGDGGIQVDVRPRAWNGSDRWFGLISRYTDDLNYYYVAMRSSGRLELKRMVGGAFTTLASIQQPVTLGRNYRLRLESVGAYHRVYLDDRKIIEARDTTLASGKLGLMTSRASADFDNLVITPNVLTPIYWNFFTPGDSPGPWSNTGPGAWAQGPNGTYAQNSLAGDARAIVGAASAEDQVVSVRARVIGFAVATGTQERWIGALLRYTDDRNYAYASLRSSNKISLRQLVDGQIRVLTEAPLTVTPGTWYSLRVEALPQATNVYVNGELVLEGPGLTGAAARGQVGLATYRAAAEYDDFLAYQP
jgi:hypothetical protein